MELLTGKAREDFEKWYQNEEKDKDIIYNIWDYFENKESAIAKNAYYIEWLDSVNICIYLTSDVDNTVGNCYEECGTCDDCYDTWHPSWYWNIDLFTEIENNLNSYESFYSGANFKIRQEATAEAIKKANEIYNNLKL